METHQQPVNQKIKRGRVHEGPRNHFLTFAVSILLTALAFFAVMNSGLNRTFINFFILFLAVVQVIFQLAFWMHMKDRGHFYAIAGLITGAIVALTAFAAALIWMWW